MTLAGKGVGVIVGVAVGPEGVADAPDVGDGVAVITALGVGGTVVSCVGFCAGTKTVSEGG